MKILCKQNNVQPNIHGQCIYTNSCSTMYSESTRCKVSWGRQIGGREHPTHAIAAAAVVVVGPRFWLSPVDIAINFHAYLLFCRTSLIIKNKSIFNGVFEKQTLFVRASVWFVLFLGSFGLRQLALKLVALKCCVYCWVLYILFVFGFIFFVRSFNRPHDRMLARNSISAPTQRLACKTRQRNWRTANGSQRQRQGHCE